MSSTPLRAPDRPTIAFIDPAGAVGHFKIAAKESGYRVVSIFLQTPHFYADVYHEKRESLIEGCDAFLFSRDFDETLEYLRQQKGLCAVISATEGGVEWGERLAHALRLRSNPIRHTAARRDKGKMRERLRNAALNHPDFAFCTTPQELERFAHNHLFPLVIKEPKGATSSGVFICHSIDELLSRFHHLLSRPGLYEARPEGVVIEEYVGGQEYIVDLFADGAKVHVTDMWAYDKIDTPFAANLYYNAITIPLDDPAVAPVADYALQVADAFEIHYGPAHIEIKDDPVRGPTLIEIGARLSGARVPLMVRAHSNFDPFQATIDVYAHGRAHIPEPISFSSHCAIAFCPSLLSGTVRSIHGIDPISALPSYENHWLALHPGDPIAPSTTFTTSPLTVFLAHPDRQQLLTDVEAVHRLFEIRLTATGPSAT